MFAISVGYPLGVKGDKYIVEFGKEILISFREAAVWMAFNGAKQIHDLNEEKVYFDRLVSLGLVVVGDTMTEIGKKIQKVVPIRQGAGSVENGENVIYLGEKKLKPLALHYSIWKLCNGDRKISKIYKYIQKEYNITYDEFLKNISCLDELDLIFLMK